MKLIECAALILGFAVPPLTALPLPDGAIQGKVFQIPERTPLSEEAYRTHGSGIDGMGRYVWTGLRLGF